MGNLMTHVKRHVENVGEAFLWIPPKRSEELFDAPRNDLRNFLPKKTTPIRPPSGAFSTPGKRRLEWEKPWRIQM